MPESDYEFQAILEVRGAKNVDEARERLGELIDVVCDGDLRISVAIDDENFRVLDPEED